MTDNDRGQVAATAAEVYEEFFLPALFDQWPEQVLDAAEAGRGDRVLDIGCGTGVLARAAQRRAGEVGQVVGLDPNEGMLAVARHADPSIQWEMGVAENIPHDEGSFERVVSQFALMFFVDRDAAVAEMARVLARRGTAAIATWASLEETPGYAAMVSLLGRLFGEQAARALEAPYVLGDPQELHGLLSSAFPDVDVTRHEGVARFDSIDAWVHTDIRGWTLANQMDDDQFELLLREAREELHRFTDAEGRVSFPAPALIATARLSGSGS
ncbi:MAG: methyltransferase domain-containing protein [Actinomycetota bacterium]